MQPQGGTESVKDHSRELNTSISRTAADCNTGGVWAQESEKRITVCFYIVATE